MRKVFPRLGNQVEVAVFLHPVHEAFCTFWGNGLQATQLLVHSHHGHKKVADHVLTHPERLNALGLQIRIVGRGPIM